MDKKKVLKKGIGAATIFMTILAVQKWCNR